MMVGVNNCPACGANNWDLVFHVTDHSITKESFNIKRCENCTLTVTSPRPDDNIISKYYQSEDYISHSGKGNSLVNSIYLLARKFSLQWKLRLIQKLKGSGNVLDIGCGTGEFLLTIKNAGFDVTGVEPDSFARMKASKLLGKDIHQSINEAQPGYDVITLWHVLEHLPDLDESLIRLNNLMNANGHLLIAVPNHESKDAHLYKEYWAGYDVPRHLWHFNKRSMATLLLKHGLTIETILPMKLDSFYVSMLSEKYRGASSFIGLVKGFLNGLRSNLAAARSNEYSSLIYIAKK